MSLLIYFVNLLNSFSIFNDLAATQTQSRRKCAFSLQIFYSTRPPPCRIETLRWESIQVSLFGRFQFSKRIRELFVTVENQSEWRKCSSCKKPIALGTRYYVCSVSTCNGQRTGYVFCSVHCFERHLPGARHKDAGAVEMTAPKSQQYNSESNSDTSSIQTEKTELRTPSRVFVNPSTNSSTANTITKKSAASIPREVLVIASRLKEYIQARSEYNTSASVMDVLSDHLRVICDRGIDNARADGRKTVMDRDFEFLKK